MNESTPTDHTIYAQVVPSGSPIIVGGALKHSGISKASNFPTPKSSPLRKIPSSQSQENSSSRLAEEKWIDGPRVSKYRVAEARHLMREINHVKKCETWIDGPNMNVPPTAAAQLATVVAAAAAVAGTAPQGSGSHNNSYGFMDSHKKKMIRQWVENQTCQIFHQVENVNVTPVQYHAYYKSQSQQKLDAVVSARNEDDRSSVGSKNDEFVSPLNLGLTNLSNAIANYSESSIKTGLKQLQQQGTTTMELDQDMHSEKSNASESRQFLAAGGDMEEEDQDSGPSEVPPALPLIEPLGSREVSRHVSRESLCQNIIMMDCALQVTEDDIAKAMGG